MSTSVIVDVDADQLNVAVSLEVGEPLSRSPTQGFDAGLRPDPFPDRTASLLPGLLAATQTGLAPAGDDELTTSDELHIHLQGITRWRR